MNERGERINTTLDIILGFFDGRKVGHRGGLGFRRTTDMAKMARCIEALKERGLIRKEGTVFMDLGAGDGRVNVLMSYFVKKSIGIEIEPHILKEYPLRRKELKTIIEERGGLAVPDNIHLFEGDSLDDSIYEKVSEEAGAGFCDVDLFYTYITLHDVFAEKIAKEAKKGALYMVYGFSRVMPAYPGLRVLDPDLAGQGIAILYQKQ